MTPERWRQLTGIFGGAVAIGDTAAREAYLVEACGSDVSLRAQLDSLMVAYGEDGSPLSGHVLPEGRLVTRLEIGTMLGPYQVEGLLGAGGMGEVYRARDTRLDRTVALKILPPHLRANPQLLARFEHEARAVAHLNHPYICTLHDVGRHENIGYLVMELVEGETLGNRLRRGVLPIEEAIAVTRQVAEALAAAHAKGVIHRDIKPSNIILTKAGHVKVVDFGLARESPLPSSTVTTHGDETDHGLRMGTLHYMSAEQSLGLPLDERTDVFSLGVVLFECLTGQLPFEGETRPAYMLDLVQGTPKSVASLRPDAPHALQAILGRCLERDLSTRLDSAALLAEELHRLARPEKFSAWTLAAAVLAGVLAVVLLVQAWSATPADSPPRTLRRFTTNPGEETNSRLSPDGSWMSFMRTERGETQLVVQRTDPGAEPTRVTLPPGALQSHLWSPDQTGHAALMSAGETKALHIVRGIFGSETPEPSITLREIPGAARLLRWIGRSIYFNVQEPKRSISLRRLDLDSSRLEVVNGPWTTMNVSSIDVRPDGLAVAWIAPASGSQREDIWTASMKGEPPTPLTAPDDTSRKRYVLWNALGNKLIYQSNLGGQPDLWELDVKTRQSTRLTTDPGQERAESSSRDGSISYQLTTEKTALYIWREGRGPGTQLSNSGLSDFAPSASSGTPLRLAYQRSQAEPVEGFIQMDTEIHVSDVIEPEMTLGKSTPIATGIVPKISPDGRYVAYLQLLRAKSSDARLMVNGVGTTEKWEVSPSLIVPTNNNFPVWWTEPTVAWLSARDLCFVERTGSSVTSRLMRYHLGEKATLVMETGPTTRITEIYPSSSGTRIAFLTRTNRPETRTKWDYAVHVVDLATGNDHVLKHLGTSTTIRLRGWLANDAGVLLARPRLSEDPPRTYDLLAISPTGAISLVGNLENASSIFSFVPNRSELYFTSLTAGIGNLFAYSLIGREKRPLTDSPVVDLAYGAAAPLGSDYLVGIRHERVKDIHLLDARSSPARSGNRR